MITDAKQINTYDTIVNHLLKFIVDIEMPATIINATVPIR